MDWRLKCASCGSDLELRVEFDGCDWETVAGENSGYKYPISLICQNNNCRNVYIIGRLKNEFDFSASNTETRPFVDKKLELEAPLFEKYDDKNEGAMDDSRTEYFDLSIKISLNNYRTAHILYKTGDFEGALSIITGALEDVDKLLHNEIFLSSLFGQYNMQRLYKYKINYLKQRSKYYLEVGEKGKSQNDIIESEKIKELMQTK